MVAPESKPQRRPRPAILESLNASFPVFRDGVPLAIGIHKSIRERMPDIEQGPLSLALRQHTASTKYLKAVSQGRTRFDLDGQPAGEVSAEQRQLATETLKERFRKGAEQKRAEQQEKERQEKLLKLAEKFNAR